MKLSKEDLLKKVSEKVLDEDVSIELLEDITDSMNETEDTTEEDNQRYKELETKYNDLLEKYKERFLTSDKKAEETEDIEEKEDEKVIDIKEI